MSPTACFAGGDRAMHTGSVEHGGNQVNNWWKSIVALPRFFFGRPPETGHRINAVWEGRGVKLDPANSWCSAGIRLPPRHVCPFSDVGPSKAQRDSGVHYRTPPRS